MVLSPPVPDSSLSSRHSGLSSPASLLCIPPRGLHLSSFGDRDLVRSFPAAKHSHPGSGWGLQPGERDVSCTPSTAFPRGPALRGTFGLRTGHSCGWEDPELGSSPARCTWAGRRRFRPRLPVLSAGAEAWDAPSCLLAKVRWFGGHTEVPPFLPRQRLSWTGNTEKGRGSRPAGS